MTTNTPLRRRDPWLRDWDPEDVNAWQSGGARVARRNLLASMFAEHIAFGVWVVWTVVVVNLADAGIRLPVSDLFVLTLLPNLLGAILRIPYTAAVTRFGGRSWTTASALLLLVPTVALAVVVPSHWLAGQTHAVQLVVLGLCAAASGVGGGNFASSTANISFFYPRRRQGWALGFNAAGGNLGVATSQLLIPLVVVAGVPTAAVHLAHHRVHLAYAGWVWLPLIVAAVVWAWTRMDSVEGAASEPTPYRDAIRRPHTWTLALLYVGSFGSFIGFSFALPLIIRTSFPTFLADHPFVATYLGGLGFLGALLGSASRPLGGLLGDRFGGATVTLSAFSGMALTAGAALEAVVAHSFGWFMASFCALFVLTGVANGSVYKLIPVVFGADPDAAARERASAARLAAAVMGITGSVGALGGVLVQAALRQASLGVSALESHAPTASARAAVAAAHAAWSAPALGGFLVSYLLLAGVTWAVYLRRQPGPTPSVSLRPAAAGR